MTVIGEYVETQLDLWRWLSPSVPDHVKHENVQVKRHTNDLMLPILLLIMLITRLQLNDIS